MRVHPQSQRVVFRSAEAVDAPGRLPAALPRLNSTPNPQDTDHLELSTKRSGAALSEPALDDPQRQSYADSRAPLGLNKIDFKRDVLQGLTIEDCYFAAPVAAIACLRPEFFRDAMHENPDGSVTVRFFKCDNPHDVAQTFTPVFVTVSRKVVVDVAGKHCLGHAASQKLWYALLEKAYAQFQGGYKAISHRGLPEVAMGALLGQPVLTFDPLPDALFDRIAALTHAKAAAIVVWGKDRPLLGSGIQDRHCYSVLKTRVVHGERLVTLRNTFGFGEPMDLFGLHAKDGKNDGIFEITFAEMARLLPIYRECALPCA